MPHKFIKMHGAGNDFVIFDARKKALKLTAPQVVRMSARRTGVGCDQVIVMEKSAKADVFMRIYNPDGSESSACGNATRCVGWLLMEETGEDSCTIATKAGLLACKRAGKDIVSADMGTPHLDWKGIPLSEPRDTVNLGFSIGDLSEPSAVGMGNPHLIFVVGNVAAAPVGEFGPQLEHYPLFPERANVSFAQVINDHEIALRVWERGAGETLACGTAACATLVALHRRGLVSEKASIHLPGGTLEINWDKASGHVWMTGPVVKTFEGRIDI